MGKITTNFTIEEAEYSETAERRNITNRIPIPSYGIMKILFENLIQPLRDVVGPIRITSGYRCSELNLLLGGSPISQHCYSKNRGAAVDISHYHGKYSTAEIINVILKLQLKFDQLILEYPKSANSGWLHASIGGCAENSNDYRYQILVKERNKPYVTVNPLIDNKWGIKFDGEDK